MNLFKMLIAANVDVVIIRKLDVGYKATAYCLLNSSANIKMFSKSSLFKINKDQILPCLPASRTGVLTAKWQKEK